MTNKIRPFFHLKTKSVKVQDGSELRKGAGGRFRGWREKWGRAKKEVEEEEIMRRNRESERKNKQGRIHGSISRVQVGRGSILAGQGQ